MSSPPASLEAQRSQSAFLFCPSSPADGQKQPPIWRKIMVFAPCTNVVGISRKHWSFFPLTHGGRDGRNSIENKQAR